MAAQAQEQKWDKYKNVGIEAQKFKSTAMGVTTDARDTLMTTLVTGELVKIAIGDIGISGGTETDPVFTAHPAFNVTSLGLSNAATAFGWGNHAVAGYALDNAVVKLTGNQTVGGVKTFIGNNIHSGSNQFTNANPVTSNKGFRANGADSGYTTLVAGGVIIYSTSGSTNWAIGNREGNDISDRIGIRPNNNWTGGVLEYDWGVGQMRWEIDNSPILTQANASSLGVVGTDDQTLSLGSNAAMNDLSIAIENGNSVNLAEDVQDEVANMFATGTHVGATVTYNDTNGGMSINVTGGGSVSFRKTFLTKTANFNVTATDVVSGGQKSIVDVRGTSDVDGTIVDGNLQTGDVVIFQTNSATSTLEIIPDANEVFIWDGQTAGHNAMRLTGGIKQNTLLKLDTNLYRFDGDGEGFVYSSDPFLAINPDAYWNANDLAAGAFTTWTDQVGGYVFQPITTAPIVQDRGAGVLEVSLTNGTDDALRLPSAVAALNYNVLTEQPYVIIHFGDEPIPINISRYLFGDNEVATNNTFAISSNSSGDNMTLRVGGGSFNLPLMRPLIADSFVVIRVVGTVTEVWLNNSLFATYTNVSNVGTGQWTLGNRPTNPQTPALDVSYRKFILGKGGITTTEMTDLYNARNNY